MFSFIITLHSSITLYIYSSIVVYTSVRRRTRRTPAAHQCHGTLIEPFASQPLDMIRKDSTYRYMVSAFRPDTLMMLFQVETEKAKNGYQF